MLIEGPINEPMSAYLERAEFFTRGEILAAFQGPRTWKHETTRAHEATPATDFGDLVHTLILEPDEYDNRYEEEPDLSTFLTNAGKPAKNPRATAAYAAWKESIHAQGKRVPIDLEKAQAIRDAVRAHPAAFQLLAHQYLVEQTILFSKDTHPVRVRPDIITRHPVSGRYTVADLKTAKNPEPRAFRYQMEDMGYIAAPAIYSAGVRHALEVDSVDFVWIVAGKTEPHHVRVYRASGETMEKSQRIFDQGIELAARYRRGEAEQRHDHPGVEDIDPIPLSSGHEFRSEEIVFGSK